MMPSTPRKQRYIASKTISRQSKQTSSQCKRNVLNRGCQCPRLMPSIVFCIYQVLIEASFVRRRTAAVALHCKILKIDGSKSKAIVRKQLTETLPCDPCIPIAHTRDICSREKDAYWEICPTVHLWIFNHQLVLSRSILQMGIVFNYL